MSFTENEPHIQVDGMDVDGLNEEADFSEDPDSVLGEEPGARDLDHSSDEEGSQY